MTKADLVNVVSAETEISKKTVDAVVSGVLEAITNALKENGITELGGKANFALSFMIAKGYFANVTFSNVTVEALNESDFPALFG